VITRHHTSATNDEMTVFETHTEPGRAWAGAVVLGTAVGTACATTFLRTWISSLHPTLMGASPQALWHLSRPTGLAAEVISMLAPHAH
jgi:hypothetical protein